MSAPLRPKTRIVRHGDLELLVVDLSPLRPLPATLTRSEREVVTEMIEGASNAEIAKSRGTSMRTVANQLKSAYRKLGVFSRAELVALIGVVPPSDSPD